MFPSALAIQDLTPLQQLLEVFPQLRTINTYSVTVNEQGIYSWCLNRQSGNLQDDDLVPFLPQGNSWRCFGARRSWTLIPVFLPQTSTILFGIERVILAD